MDLRPAALFVLTGAVLALALGGCATGADAGDEAAAARGAAVAERDCGTCHGLGLAGVSRYPDAPPFRAMRFDYNAISHERSIARLHRGQVSMPPVETSLADIADLAAYVRSLKAQAR